MDFLHYAGSIYHCGLALLQTAPLMVIWWCFVAIYIVVTLPSFYLKKPIFAGFFGILNFLGLLISGAVCTLSISFHDDFWWLFFAFHLSWIVFFIYIGSLIDRLYPDSSGGLMIYMFVFYPLMFASPLAVLIHVIYKYVLGY